MISVKKASNFKFRIIASLTGFFFPIFNSWVVGYLDHLGETSERSFILEIPIYVFFTIHAILTIPGMFFANQGIYTYLLVGTFWGGVGYFVGKWLDKKTGLSEKLS